MAGWQCWMEKSRLNSGLVSYFGLLKLLPVEPEEELSVEYNTLKP